MSDLEREAVVEAVIAAEMSPDEPDQAESEPEAGDVTEAEAEGPD